MVGLQGQQWKLSLNLRSHWPVFFHSTDTRRLTFARNHHLYVNHRRRQWHPTPVLSPGKSHGRRCLVGCSPWGCWGSDTTERLHFHFLLSYIGEGNGTHSSVLAWRIPGTQEPGGLLFMGSHRVGHDWNDLAAAAAEILYFHVSCGTAFILLGKSPLVDWTLKFSVSLTILDSFNCFPSYNWIQ